MEINICVYYEDRIKDAQQIDKVLTFLQTLDERAAKGNHYFAVITSRFSNIQYILRRNNYDFCIFFTLNPSIVALMQWIPYMSHIVVLEDFSTCPALFAGWEQLPSPEGSQQWRPAAWKQTGTTVLVTTSERLVEDAFAFFKQEGLSFNP